MGNNINNAGNKLNTKNTNRAALGILIGAIVVIFAAAFYMAWPGMTPTEDTGKTPPPKPIQLTDQQQQERVAEIVASDDLSKCESVKGIVIGEVDYYKVCRDNIFFNQARAQLDFSSCDKLGGGTAAVTDCQRLIIAEKASQAESSAICDGVPGSLEEFCRSNYWAAEALRRSDTSACEEITEESAATLCRESVLISQLSTQPSTVNCELFSKSTEKDCLNFKKAIKNRVDCGTINDPRLRSACGEAVSAP